MTEQEATALSQRAASLSEAHDAIKKMEDSPEKYRQEKVILQEKIEVTKQVIAASLGKMCENMGFVVMEGVTMTTLAISKETKAKAIVTLLGMPDAVFSEFFHFMFDCSSHCALEVCNEEMAQRIAELDKKMSAASEQPKPAEAAEVK